MKSYTREKLRHLQWYLGIFQRPTTALLINHFMEKVSLWHRNAVIIDCKLIGMLRIYGLSAFYYVLGVPHEVSSLIKHTITHHFLLEM